MNIPHQLSQEMGLEHNQVLSTISLLDEGATVPFIARYRKERTGNLEEVQIRGLSHRLHYYRELEERKQTILDSIRAQGKLTPDLEKKIETTTSKTELEDLYLPFKPKRATRASKARGAGLEPLAQWLRDLKDPSADLSSKAAGFIDVEKGFDTPEAVLQGACDILAEDLSNDAGLRKQLRELALDKGLFTAKVKKDHEGTKTKFQMYYDFREPVKHIPSHRMLALLRGEKEKILRLSLDMPEDRALKYLERDLILHPRSASAGLLKTAARDAYERLLLPAVETEVRKEIRNRADEEAIRVFAVNLRELLLAPPAGHRPVLGVDPGFRTGCKIAVLDETGQYLEDRTIYPHEPRNAVQESEATLLSLVEIYRPALIAVGNGTAGRETEVFIRKALSGFPAEKRPVCLMVSEAGASVYSASDVALKEFPDLDVTVRGAVSIGRRLQDPLSELVKIDPKSIGVGQYQHDVDQKRLKTSLEEMVESCVNLVGVDLNLASEELLKYVSGLTRTVARHIIDHRDQNGPFQTREDLLRVSGVGEKTFEQAAGFLRIPEGGHPLDNSAVHPERYALVEVMARTLNTSLHRLIGNKGLLQSLDRDRFVSRDVGRITIEDILSELEKPGRDPRRTFEYARFSETVQDINDLNPGMILEGTVTNVTNFGAFVDIGVHQDGLVHISEMADRYVRDPLEVVKVGQVVKVRVLSVDPELKRIALSLKNPAGQAPSGP